ncbi:MAG TPA: type II toxin-antitoxin system VapC family toxin [Gemmatimonadaceae bacterium]|nr:type II toxin-antitoxin system VapC family toxin [Gemmatimonadaceae bacterium]
MKRTSPRAARPLPEVWRPDALADYDGPLLLDTHVWLWLLEGDESQWSRATGALLDRVGSASRLLVSDISAWEVAVKAGKGKLTLSIDVAVWLQRAERAPGIRFLPLDRQQLLLSTRLPGEVHGDPADRMLLAATLLHHVPLVTADRAIVEYARATPGVPVVDVRVR